MSNSNGPYGSVGKRDSEDLGGTPISAMRTRSKSRLLHEHSDDKPPFQQGPSAEQLRRDGCSADSDNGSDSSFQRMRRVLLKPGGPVDARVADVAREIRQDFDAEIQKLRIENAHLKEEVTDLKEELKYMKGKMEDFQREMKDMMVKANHGESSAVKSMLSAVHTKCDDTAMKLGEILKDQPKQLKQKVETLISGQKNLQASLQKQVDELSIDVLKLHKQTDSNKEVDVVALSEQVKELMNSRQQVQQTSSCGPKGCADVVKDLS